mmetsp:Transcript_9649/g.15324  ORF Transcript_9649/g.15324 Transcript_9649/m.15324 type:complete len:85 (-) Transcript_9649:767-1021(-)
MQTKKQESKSAAHDFSLTPACHWYVVPPGHALGVQVVSLVPPAVLLMMLVIVCFHPCDTDADTSTPIVDSADPTAGTATPILLE